MQRIARHVTYANVVATLALLVAIGGSAYAAVRVGSSNIVDGSIRSVDVRNQSLTGVDVRNASIAMPDLTPAARATLTDTSPWEKIPSGKTITGEFQLEEKYTGADTYTFPIHFPARAPAALTNSTVNFIPGAAAVDDDPDCSGTDAAPTAPPGKVCIYPALISGTVANLAGRSQLILGTSGFNVMWSDTGAGAPGTTVRASWAYTAP